MTGESFRVTNNRLLKQKSTEGAFSKDKARFLHGILAAEGVEKPVLIGPSMGGYASQMSFELYPGEARGLVSIDPAPLQRKEEVNHIIEAFCAGL